MKTKILTLGIILWGLIANAQSIPTIASGKIERIENFSSRFVESRNVDVWLPDGYNSNKKYSVVYMQDGQMLFDSTKTWNKKEWGVDETFSRLINQGKINRCIVVAIWNSGTNRISDYFPNKIFTRLTDKTKNTFTEKYTNGKSVNSDNYLKFMVNELKPYIDKNYSTYPDKDHSFLIGSSMGAAISLYAINEYPEVFGGVACLSTAWLSSLEPNYEIPAATFDYLKHNLASPNGHKIYMDYGTGESDKNYEVTQSFIDLIIKGKGFSSYNYLSKVYEKEVHDEVAWSKRLNIPIEFLLGKFPDQKPATGKIEKYEDFQSKYLTERNIEVWLPADFNPAKKYSVLYMHDGQMLFDPSTTWTQSAWQVDQVLTKLVKDHKIKDVIVVGIWNSGTKRHREYFPQKPFESLTTDQQDFINKSLQSPGGGSEVFKPVSDNYLKFIVSELKPFIDKKYPVYKDRKHTFIAGSSMGGLISMYAICEYPAVFGGAACLSTHWPGIFSMEGNPVPDAFVNYLRNHLPDPKTHKLYFDYGDQTLDAMYPPLQKKVDEVLKLKGFTTKNWKTLFFPGNDHSEISWNRRLDIPIEFLLKN